MRNGRSTNVSDLTSKRNLFSAEIEKARLLATVHLAAALPRKPSADSDEGDDVRPSRGPRLQAES